MTQAKAARWLNLVAYLLQHRFAVTREQIFTQVRGYRRDDESTRRTFERDKDELRALGIEIESVPLKDAAGDEPATGYRLRAQGVYLPSFELEDSAGAGPPYPNLHRIRLTPAELALLDRATRRLAQRAELPVARAAASARRKLAFDLPLLEVPAADTVLAFPLPPAGRQALAVLQEAVAGRIAVTCRYYSIGRDADEERTIEPYGLLFEWSHWYCVGRPWDRETPRRFRLDRMRDARLLSGPGSRFDPPAEFDVRAYLGQAPWEWGDRPLTPVQVRFAFPESRWILNRQAARPVAPPGPGAPGAEATFEFGVRDPEPFLRWLLGFQDRATVVEPDTMARSLDALRADVARLYREPAP